MLRQRFGWHQPATAVGRASSPTVLRQRFGWHQPATGRTGGRRQCPARG